MTNIICPYDNSLQHNLILFSNDHYNYHLFDGFSLSHVFYGVLGGVLFNKWWVFLMVAIIFEIIENSPIMVNMYRRAEYKHTKDSVVNILGDLMSNMLGFLIYHSTPMQYKWVILVVFLITEVILHLKNLEEYSAFYMLKKNITNGL